ncbi:MAG: hypothetical protein HOP08_10510 [Cyclobacteriaceae bacterium]|nr:hypothetical protein [Cyclobacteriaceae bacterium]
MVHRPLYIDFSLYAHGDPDFKKELIKMMVSDLMELQQSLQLSFRFNEISFYKRVCNKINSTLNMLDDREFIDIVEEIKSDNSNEEKAASFNRLCVEIVNSLEANQNEKNPRLN